ncbi:MAG: pyridoxal phosphate-dependent aminotransferase [Alicyclobacillus herbarius]|uniref:MalY/PatB family protein n=1 Tax=Alicyclobacillus herbarius TaxID=122960 RepID=UPI002352B219|nr:MalY/PatB family protein [Alicyclobacillus herbarius]MCL6632260.1 pyridoxal phosphate-dependent aminotransferase [Alicyclobacillus herbarius]
MKYNFDQTINRAGTDCSKWDGLEERFGTTDALPMWVADMDFQSPEPVLAALRQRIDHGVFGYPLVTKRYLEAAADWYRRRQGWQVQAEWLAHAPGVVPAISILIEALTEPGDGVLVQPPVYYPFMRVIRETGRRIVENPLVLQNGKYVMDFDDLDQKLAHDHVKLVILCSPHNPVGRVWEKDELLRFAEVCARRDVRIIADEIHGDLILPGHKHTPLASLSPFISERTVTCVAPSKTFNLAGLQTALVIAENPQLRQAYVATQRRRSQAGANVLGLVAAEAAYRHGDDWLDELLAYLEGNVNLLVKAVAEDMPGVSVIRPQGTYLVWMDFRELGLSTQELDKFCLTEARIAFDEGHIFGTGGAGFMRMNIGCPRSLVEEAVTRLRRALAQAGRNKHLHP